MGRTEWQAQLFWNPETSCRFRFLFSLSLPHTGHRLQPPGVLHAVYTPVKTIATGGHFFTYDTLHLTEIARAYDNSFLNQQLRKEVATNNEHPAVPRQITRMLLALPRLVTSRRESFYH
jgi:hypothetical protein